MCFCCLSDFPCQNTTHRCSDLHCSAQRAFSISQTVAGNGNQPEEDGPSDEQKVERKRIQNTHSRSVSLGVVGDSVLEIDNHRPVVFPPINHEGLPVSSDNRDGCNCVEGNQEEFKISPSPVAGAARMVTQLVMASELANWGSLFQLWRNKLARIGVAMGRFSILRRLNWSSGSAISVLLLWLVCAMVRWRRKRLPNKTKSRSHLIRMIKEKDEKINQLLHQIAQMNQLLLSLHKGSLSKGG